VQCAYVSLISRGVLVFVGAASFAMFLSPLAQGVPDRNVSPSFSIYLGAADDLGPPRSGAGVPANIQAVQTQFADLASPVSPLASVTQSEPVMPPNSGARPQPVIASEFAARPQPVIASEFAARPQPAIASEPAARPQPAVLSEPAARRQLAALVQSMPLPKLTTPPATLAATVDLPVAAMPSWTGFYAGIAPGIRWGKATWTTVEIDGPSQSVSGDSPTSFDNLADRIGGYFGHTWQFASRWAAGFEGDFGWGDNKKTVGGIPGLKDGATTNALNAALANDSATIKESWDGSLRARFGFFLFPTVMLYATGGLALQDVEVDFFCAGVAAANTASCGTQARVSEKEERLLPGWIGGGGAEVKLSGNWLARAEYRYADFGTFRNRFGVSNPASHEVTVNVDVKTHTALLGLTYQFD